MEGWCVCVGEGGARMVCVCVCVGGGRVHRKGQVRERETSECLKTVYLSE